MASLDDIHCEGQRMARSRADSQQTLVAARPVDEEFSTARAHPCHAHALVRVDALQFYSHVEPPGAWFCNQCRRRSSDLKERYPWHCAAEKTSPPTMLPPCQYDLCNECMHGSVHPLHEHPLRLTDANVTYVNENGIWSCEYCNLDRMSTKERYPYHCVECRFDLCVRCYEGIRHPLHPHRLLPAKADLVYAEHGGMWFCDMCHASRKQLRESHMWHCLQCSFDLCASCANGLRHKQHGHKLYLADANVAYANFSGLWSCDHCGTSRKACGQRFMRHCAECSFDLCNTCFTSDLAVATSAATSAIGYALGGPGTVAAGDGGGGVGGISLAERKQTLLQDDHRRDNQPESTVIPRSKSGTLRVGSIGEQFEEIDFESDPKKEAQLEYVDLSSACENKMRRQEKETEPAEPTTPVPAAGRSCGDGQLCLLCMELPRNATFVHGETGHLACCMRCAKRLQSDGLACPVCRQPISAVIEQFIA